ncbi:DNA integrity scanning protein DisA with diadenylate cyclase activity [Virgibacillus natechei]|uniref:DNA integrity scanning protein DisA with diadenylate cyclase activity n=1 Tax=Virgibacillus natechei TaxID=1216297 RepID=A0ABS4ID62_9BACI|nr:YtpI family protein [Virgibacillus natechei]MBP1968887.1 DNA integrity scanning protein DisA with diadenylate cyclase activity [Virgibacillus natechei]UZD11681.1 YtpI family protein [Virgibacillus natechei]
MVIFPIIIVISIVLYVYYKVAIMKNKDKLTQLYVNAKSRICLGSLVFFFGINQYVFYQTQFALFVGIVFVIIGGALLYDAFKEAKHYRNEWKRLNV